MTFYCVRFNPKPPHPSSPSPFAPALLLHSSVTGVLMSFHKQLLVFATETTESTTGRIRELLNMQPANIENTSRIHFVWFDLAFVWFDLAFYPLDLWIHDPTLIANNLIPGDWPHWRIEVIAWRCLGWVSRAAGGRMSDIWCKWTLTVIEI